MTWRTDERTSIMRYSDTFFTSTHIFCATFLRVKIDVRWAPPPCFDTLYRGGSSIIKPFHKLLWFFCTNVCEVGIYLSYSDIRSAVSSVCRAINGDLILDVIVRRVENPLSFGTIGIMVQRESILPYINYTNWIIINGEENIRTNNAAETLGGLVRDRV